MTQQTAKPLGARECRHNSAVPLSRTLTVLWCSHHTSGSEGFESLTFEEDRVDFDCCEHREWILYLMKTLGKVRQRMPLPPHLLSSGAALVTLVTFAAL